ncbi:MMPL family transporter [Demequina activiva]|uniref:SSD domain-containing protein n=1 Tax=Demequina activiva TaxID=1582364 RepID=A0A919UK99_9MICO|nr:MMPL family transporter [Demequina activiva]GIG53488.1 hypothetical protein Dac01nite_02400 [Demequina activiva]
MAHFLFRLGRSSALHPIRVILAWALALGLAAGSFLAFGGTLTDSFSIPGTETDRVAAELSDEVPAASGANARVVFETQDGSAFTAEQEEQVSSALAAALDVEHVTAVVDPFATQADREAQEQQLTDGQAQVDGAAAEIEAGREQLAAGQDQLDQAAAELDEGQAQLDAAIAQAQDAGTFDAAASQFEAQQEQIDQGRAQLAEQQAELDAGAAELDAGEAELAAQSEQLALGQELATNASALRTVSEDGSAALGIVQFDVGALDLPQSSKDGVIDEVSAMPLDGVEVYFSADLATSVDGILGVGEIVGVAIALIVLIVMMRAFMPAIQPIITSLVGVSVGVAASLSLSGSFEMSSVTPVLGVMLALAVGIDYSLFIINRHRTQVRAGMDVHESIGLANGTSGNAVVFAGATVLIALLALNISGIPFISVMGSVAAFCVFVAVLVAITLTPAVLGLTGTKVLGKKARASIGSPDHAEKPAQPMKTWRAVVRFAVAAGALAIVSIPFFSMRLGLPDGTQEAEDSTQYQAYTTVDDKFGEGVNGTLLVTARLPQAVAEEEQLAAQAALTSAFMEQEDVVAAAPAGVSEDGDFLAFQVIPAEGPSSESTEVLVHTLRDQSPLESDDALIDGAELGVAGSASGNIDISEKLSEALPVYLAVVVGLSLIILIIVFRSLLVPLVATGGFVLSLFAAFGATTAVFQWGWLGDLFGVHDPGPILSFLPIMLTGILFGLAMDYQLFLTSGMREAFVHGNDARTSVVLGMRHGRAVVTAAAIIMASVFGGFIFSHISTIRPMGFGLAVGVLLDAFVVRMLIVPALMHLMGEKAWWLPRWLDRIVPNVDVEGAALEREHPVPAETVREEDAKA